MLVELDGSDGPLGDGGHLGLVKRDVYAMIRVANPYFLDPRIQGVILFNKNYTVA